MVLKRFYQGTETLSTFTIRQIPTGLDSMKNERKYPAARSPISKVVATKLYLKARARKTLRVLVRPAGSAALPGITSATSGVTRWTSVG